MDPNISNSHIALDTRDIALDTRLNTSIDIYLQITLNSDKNGW